MMVHMLINYQSGLKCFANFGAVRTVKHTCDIYTNDRYHGACFSTVRNVALCLKLPLVLYVLCVNSNSSKQGTK